MKKMNFKSVFFYMLAILTVSACSSDDEPEVAPNNVFADFVFSVEEGTGNVTFTNKSLEATSYEWEFGDEADGYSAEENPTYTYEESGSYNVALTAMDDNNYIKDTIQTVEINIVVPKTAISIVVNKDFSDWENIPWREDINLEGDLQGIKVAATTDKLYILVTGATSLLTTENKGAYLDLDNNLGTGSSDGRFKDGKGGADAMQQTMGYHVWGWRAEDNGGAGAIGWDWIKDGWIEYGEWVLDVASNTVTSEWKLDLKYARAEVIGNDAIGKEGVDQTTIATTTADDEISMYVWLRDASWSWIGTAPSEGEAPFKVMLGEYVEE